MLELQIVRFGAVGLSAAALHMVIFWFAIEVWYWSAVAANTLAFAIAFVYAYLGHRYWTFKPGTGNQSLTGATLFKFFGVAATGYCINTLIAWLVVDRGGYQPLWAVLLMATCTPPTVFLLAKHWAFAPIDTAR